MMTEINYEILKKRGFLRQRQEGFFVLRTRMSYGVYKKEQLEKINEIAKEFGQGYVHLTVRQGIEIPFIKYEDIPQVEAELKAAGVEFGTSGARLRTTTTCPGNNWCKQGLVNTFALAKRIEEELGLRCGLELPHKFKISISGCPNGCTRPQYSEIGIHGAVDFSSPDKHAGFAIYLGGCAGKTPRTGFKLDKLFTEEEVLSLIAEVVRFYQKHAKPRQRLGLLIEEYEKDKFLNEILR